MLILDFTKYVNVFQGNGEIDLPKPEGIAAKWFFIKAGTGNTSPAATLPYGAISAAPYSGGYPTGYLNHNLNSHSRPNKFEEGKKLLGFAHLQQSGTGAMGYYYNYAVVSPVYDTSPERRAPLNETAEPGYYSCYLENIKCELTATRFVAFHRYTFARSGGALKIDFTNNGLNIPNQPKVKAEVKHLAVYDKNTVVATIVAEGITLYFAARSNGLSAVKGGTAMFTDPGAKRLVLRLSISLLSEEKALSRFEPVLSFDEAKQAAHDAWNSQLSKVQIKTEDETLKEIFYSNLYHSYIKPADFTGESFLYDPAKPFCAGFSTLWDIYKTQLPLIFMTDKEMSEKIAETLMSLCETLGNIPNCFGLSEKYKMHAMQARMLGDYALLTAYRYGIAMDADRLLKVLETDIYAEDKTDFTVEHKTKTHTWTLDMADGCALTALLAKERGDEALYEKLQPLAALWRSVYNEETGLLRDDSDYYEGTLYNYSFRQHVSMDERITLAGGKEKFVELLDTFFGYGAPDTVQPTDPNNYAPVAEGIKLGRFEGFNNESDTETPFSYIYADRHDRTCEIIRAGMKYMFTTGRGGLPGNNDSGALSSYYVLMAFGLFPVAGQDLFLIGSPFADGGRIELSSGNVLEIKVNNNSDKNIYVEKVAFNGKEIKDFRLPAHELMQGGTLEFTMKG